MIFRSRMAILLFCWIFVGKWMVFMGCKVHDARMMQKIKEILANRTGLGWVLFQVSIIQRHQSTRAIEWSACSFWMLCWTWHFQLFSHVFPMVTNWKKSGWGVHWTSLSTDPCWSMLRGQALTLTTSASTTPSCTMGPLGPLGRLGPLGLRWHRWRDFSKWLGLCRWTWWKQAGEMTGTGTRTDKCNKRSLQ